MVQASATRPAAGGKSDSGAALGTRPARPPVETEFLRARLVSELGDDDLAVRICDRVLARDGGHLQAKEYRAKIRFDRKEYAAALPDLDAVLGARPADRSCLVARGIARAKSGRPADALTDLGEAARLYPDDSVARFARGVVLLQTGSYRAAAAEFDAVLGLGSFNPSIVCGRGMARLFAGDAGGADRDFTVALAVTRTTKARGQIRFYRGLARLGQLDLDRAVQDFAAADREMSE